MKELIGVVPQEVALYLDLSARENLWGQDVRYARLSFIAGW